MNSFAKYKFPYRKCRTCNKGLYPGRMTRKIKCCTGSFIYYYGISNIEKFYPASFPSVWNFESFFKTVYGSFPLPKDSMIVSRVDYKTKQISVASQHTSSVVSKHSVNTNKKGSK